MMRKVSALVDFVSRVPARVRVKLLAAFLAIEFLLIVTGAVGLQVLSGVNQRTEELIRLQRKIEAYRQVQHDITSQLYNVASVLLSSDDLTLSSTLRQLNQFGYNVDRLQFVAKDEVELLDRFQQDYNRFTNVVTNVLELIRAGRPAEARELQVAQATPLTDRLERLTNQLVNKAEADMVAGIEASNEAYVTSQWTVVGFALGSSRFGTYPRLRHLRVADWTCYRGRSPAQPDCCWRLFATRQCRQSRRTRCIGGQRQPDVRTFGAPLSSA